MLLDPMKTTLFIVADEQTNAGERDYMKALAAALLMNATSQNFLVVMKIGKASSNEKPIFHHNAPVNDAIYAPLPRYSAENISSIEGDVTLIGVGSTTLSTLLEAKKILEEKSNARLVDTSYITHLYTPDDEKVLASENIQVFAPLKADAAFRLHPLETVPNTNSPASCRMDYEIFSKDSRYEAMRSMIDSGAPFAFVVVNAGFSDKEDPSVWHMYTQDEAYAHGYGLGDHFPPETNLIVVDGGPRNGIEESRYGQNNFSELIAGYSGAQSNKHADPSIFRGRFQAGDSFNMIKVGYLLSQMPSCRGFISNAEGFGTMAALLQYPDNRSKLIGMLPFASQAQESTGTHLENIATYHKAGIAKLSVQNDRLVIDRHPAEQALPIMQRDAAVDILQSLGLIKLSRTLSYDAAPIPGI